MIASIKDSPIFVKEISQLDSGFLSRSGEWNAIFLESRLVKGLFFHPRSIKRCLEPGLHERKSYTGQTLQPLSQFHQCRLPFHFCPIRAHCAVVHGSDLADKLDQFIIVELSLGRL